MQHVEGFKAKSDDHSWAYMLYRVMVQLKKKASLEDPKPKQKKKKSAEPRAAPLLLKH
jgi:hypothetical protein